MEFPTLGRFLDGRSAAPSTVTIKLAGLLSVLNIGRKLEVTVWGAISYHGRSSLLRFKSNLISNRYVREVLLPEVFPFLQVIRGTFFQQDNASPHVAKSVRDFCSAQHMQLFPWSAYSPDMSPTNHVWDLVDRSLARDPRPAASKDEFYLRMKAI